MQRILLAILALAIISCQCNTRSKSATLPESGDSYEDIATFGVVGEAHSGDGKARMVGEDWLIGQILNDGVIYSDTLQSPGMANAPWAQSTGHLKMSDGKDLYVFIYSYGRHCIIDGVKCYTVDPMMGMKQMRIFKTKKSSLDVIDCEWYNPDRGITDPFFGEWEDGEKLGITLDEKTSNLYVPYIDEGDVYTGKYLVYHFNGKVFDYQGIQSASWRHPSISDYKAAASALLTDDYLVLVDEMPDGSFRYTAWKGGAKLEDMTKKPDLVINNGSFDPRGEAYVFVNDKYEYRVSSSLDEEYRLVVKKDGKILMKQ